MKLELMRAKDVKVGMWIETSSHEYAPVRRITETDFGVEFEAARWGAEALTPVPRRNGEMILVGIEG